jgi:catechol 2,3-dioxygenase-like lactoylglutathione lyase family enzyme
MRSATLLLLLSLLGIPLVSQERPKRPAITGIMNVRIVASSFDSASDFFTKKLGLGAVFSSCQGVNLPCVAINGLQRIEFAGPNPSGSPNRLTEIAFSTISVSALQRYLEAYGIKTGQISSLDDGSEMFEVDDPEGHRVAFIQRRGPLSTTYPASQVSSKLIHAGFVVHDRAAEDHFYKDILGFHLYWLGGMKDNRKDWVDMQVPDGTDWIEYMLNVDPKADKRELGIMNHIALGVPDIHVAAQQLLKNGWKSGEKPEIGLDGKWQLNLYDPDGTRVELMEFTPVQKPCCSDYTGPHPGPKL